MIKYKYLSLRNVLNKLNKDFNILEILRKISIIYKTKNLKISDIKIEYDTFEIYLDDTNINKISIDSQYKKIVVFNFDYFIEDVYKLNNEKLSFKERIFKFQNNDIIYSPRDTMKNSNFTFQKLKYINNNMNMVIDFGHKNDSDFSLENLIQALGQGNIRNIFVLYQIVKNELPEDNSEIEITNYKNSTISQFIKTRNQVLLSCLVKDLEDENKIYRYQDNKLTITTYADPLTDENFLNIKNKIKEFK